MKKKQRTINNIIMNKNNNKIKLKKKKININLKKIKIMNKKILKNLIANLILIISKKVNLFQIIMRKQDSSKINNSNNHKIRLMKIMWKMMQLEM